jgi:F-type H+-transporting ATPase subunit epsilon
MALQVSIVTPRGPVFTGDIKSCTAPGVDGEFCILEKHTPLISALGIGILKIVTAAEGKKNLTTSGGFLEVYNDKISIMVESAEMVEDIDVERAKDAAERAKKRLQQKQDIDIPRAKLALARALNRLRVSSHG